MEGYTIKKSPMNTNMLGMLRIMGELADVENLSQDLHSRLKK